MGEVKASKQRELVMKQVERLVARVAQVISASDDVPDYQISEALISEGYPLDLAERAIAFVGMMLLVFGASCP